MRLHILILALVALMAVLFLLHYFFVPEWDEVELEIHNQFLQGIREQSRNRKLILVYNHVEDRQKYPKLDGYCLDDESRGRLWGLCPYSCTYTDDKTAFEMADAVVFSATNLKTEELPLHRETSQLWVLLSMLPPNRASENLWPDDIRKLDHIFNWTMGYQPASDIWTPYGRVLEKNGSENEQKTFMTSEILQKHKLIAWITTSDCFTEVPSGRNELIRSLSRFIPVDIYGNCGPNRCSHPLHCNDLKECYRAIGPDYKFHLAIEDSLCEDYVSEGFFYALQVGMVPVVLGKANYAEIAPLGSYIDVRDFPSIEELAKYLQHLDRNQEKYWEFFEWRQYAYVSPSSPWEMGWCLLCAALWDRHERSNSSFHRGENTMTTNAFLNGAVEHDRLLKILPNNQFSVCE